MLPGIQFWDHTRLNRPETPLPRSLHLDLLLQKPLYVRRRPATPQGGGASALRLPLDQPFRRRLGLIVGQSVAQCRLPELCRVLTTRSSLRKRDGSIRFCSFLPPKVICILKSCEESDVFTAFIS